MDSKLHLLVEKIENLPADSHGCNMIAKVEWKGRERKAGFFAKRLEKSYTGQQKVQKNGSVSWNEGFHYTCKFKRERSGIYKSWIIALRIEEVTEKAKEKTKTIGKANVDVAQFLQFENNKSIKIPINCHAIGYIAEAMLTVKLQLIKLESKKRNQVTLARALSLNLFSRGPEPYSRGKLKSFKLSHKKSINLPEADPASHDNESDLQYRKEFGADSLILTKNYIEEPSVKATKQKQIYKLLCLSTTERINKGIRQHNDGDDNDNDQHHQSCIQFLTAFKKIKVRPEENLKPLFFKDSRKFEVGKWERKKLVSRDEKIELVSDVFLASIDQCSKKAAGGSACTVLAAIIADWLHNNPKSLPLQHQFDELVLKGSLEWRNLCGEKNHKAKFSDKHFDLDTVLEAKVRSLTVATEKSYVGFFSMDEMPEGFGWLQGEMCFDNIWNNMICTDVTEERIYVVSWNDHFFVLKVESEAIYLLDTLGERLAEGCKQAYILKFDAESAIYRRVKDGKERGSEDLVSEGIGCCKEYIKGFLSAIPLRELQEDIKRGQAKQELLHRLLQIDFHYTAPCNRTNS